MAVLVPSNKVRRIVVSGAKYTDIDGLACAIGMAEFLRLTKPLDVAIAYVPRKAVWNETIPSFVRDELKAARTSANGRLDDEYLNDTDDFCFAEESDRLVIVDTCNPDFVDRDGHTPKIAASSRPSMGEEELAALSGNARTRWSSSAIEVESVIDHHLQQSWRDKWVSFPPTCELQIEEVASCATLVAERFARAEVVPSGLTVASRLAPSAFALQLSALTLRCMPSGTAAAHGDLEQQPRLPGHKPHPPALQNQNQTRGPNFAPELRFLSSISRRRPAPSAPCPALT